MSIWRLLRSREPDQIIRNREFLKQRRQEQFKLLNNPSVFVDRSVLDMKLRQLIGKPNLVYSFGREAIKHEWLNGLADVNFETALTRPGTIPFSVKDHLRVKGMIQTCGFSDNIKVAQHSSEVVNILEESGMTPYVQSNIPQGLWGLESTNYVFGQSKNPYNPEFVSGGSSGGQCVLVKTRSSAFGLGSDSAGSVRIPASFCGVYSFKPSSSRRLSRIGRIALSGEQIQVVKQIDACMGFITKCVDDLEFLLEKTLGKSTIDWNVTGLWNHQRYEKGLKRKFKFGYMTSTYEVKTAPAIVNAIQQVIAKLQQQGHQVVEFQFDELPQLKDNLMKFNSGVYETIRRRLNQEMAVENNRQYIHLMKLGNWAIRLRQWWESDVEKKRIYQGLPAITLQDFMKTVRDNQLLKAKFRQAWMSKGIDVLITPTMPFPAILHNSSKYLINLLTFCCFQNLLEMPSGVVPVRLVKPQETIYEDNSFYGRELQQSIRKSAGLPVAIQVTGKTFQDEETLAAMAIIEQLIGRIPDP